LLFVRHLTMVSRGEQQTPVCDWCLIGVHLRVLLHLFTPLDEAGLHVFNGGFVFAVHLHKDVVPAFVELSHSQSVPAHRVNGYLVHQWGKGYIYTAAYGQKLDALLLTLVALGGGRGLGFLCLLSHVCGRKWGLGKKVDGTGVSL
jgi:hypothetical protein